MDHFPMIPNAENGLFQDFLKNGFKNFVLMRSKDETNHYLSFGSGPMFWKNVDPELWIIF